MKKMRHKHIVTLYECIDDPEADSVYLVMQYISGGPIAKLDDDGECAPISLSNAIRFTKQLGGALHFMHRRGVVHGDIKPDNILVDKGAAASNGGSTPPSTSIDAGPQAYFADFGVSRAFGGAAARTAADDRDGAAHANVRHRRSTALMDESALIALQHFADAAAASNAPSAAGGAGPPTGDGPTTARAKRRQSVAIQWADDAAAVTQPASPATATSPRGSPLCPGSGEGSPLDRGPWDDPVPRAAGADDTHEFIDDADSMAADTQNQPTDVPRPQMHRPTLVDAALLAGVPGADDDDDDDDGDEYGAPNMLSPSSQRKQNVAVGLGTPAFFAPELFNGGSPTFETDMWAFGATLYVLVFGRLPFPGENYFEMKRGVCQNPLRFPPASAATRKWQKVIAALLDKDPARRLTAMDLRRCRLFQPESAQVSPQQACMSPVARRRAQTTRDRPEPREFAALGAATPPERPLIAAFTDPPSPSGGMFVDDGPVVAFDALVDSAVLSASTTSGGLLSGSFGALSAASNWSVGSSSGIVVTAAEVVDAIVTRKKSVRFHPDRLVVPRDAAGSGDFARPD
jgi:serine/threonine protein kinase